ncbi:MAG: cytochrome b/b6 domain-containing protein [Methylotenera sp.]
MTLRNTSLNYGSVAKWLHWSIALLFLLAYCSVYFRHWFTEKETPANLVALHLHLSAGVSVGVLVLLRIIWRLGNPQPTLEPSGRLGHWAAHAGHAALYAIIILAPLTGYLGTKLSTDFFFLFEIPKFDDTWMFKQWIERGLNLTFEEFEKPIDFLHKNILGLWLNWVLILGHVGAALYHHFVLKDRTLIKMTSGIG